MNESRRALSSDVAPRHLHRVATRAMIALIGLGGGACMSPAGGPPGSAYSVNPPYVRPVRIEVGKPGTPISLLVKVENDGPNRSELKDHPDNTVTFSFVGPDVSTSADTPATRTYSAHLKQAVVNTIGTYSPSMGTEVWIKFCDEDLRKFLAEKTSVAVRFQLLRSDHKWSYSPPGNDDDDSFGAAAVPIIPTTLKWSACPKKL